MKKIVLLSVAILFVAGVIVVSCRKDNTFNGAEDIKHIKSLSKSMDKSVFDEVGRKHNELLELYDYDRLEQGIDDAKTYFDSVLIVQGIYSVPSQNSVLELFRDANGNYYNDSEQEEKELRKKYALFDIDSIVFSSIIDRFYEFTDGLSENSLTQQDALSFIDQYEKNIDNTHMSYEERVAILTSIYLSRYSVNYWTDHLSKQDLVDQGYEKKKKKGSFWKKFKCTACIL